MTEPTDSLDQIAVIGLACRFPGATDAAELWRNLQQGVHSISFFSDEELAAAGVPEEARSNPNYVRANGVLDGADRFDAEFFGFTPREAELMDPQHRLFLEHAWMACENAGYDPQTFRGRIGVYGGSSTNSYFLSNLLTNPELLSSAGSLQARLSSDKDFLATQVSYKLNLRGPSLTVQSACSTSLVAVHLACQAILDGDCDMALAGGVSVGFPQNEGYTYVEGGISSPDGHCRAFDADAKGTVGGNGVGVVLLKRLDDALADGDPIHAVILGTAVNNDGSLKAGFTAPSVESQAEVVADALSMARVDAGSIGMVEAHGSGTPLGDPIEVESLTRAFRASTDRKSFCALGSIKTNLGHCDAAAGIAGLIKAALAVEHGQIPPSLHYQHPNPNTNLDGSPFYVNTELRDWPAEASPRRASVNSLGMGGTNAHVVLQEPPEREPSSQSRPWQLLLLSARTAPALETATANLSGWLAARPGLSPEELADAAHTLRVGRKAFRHRRAAVCRDRGQALELLASGDPSRVLTADAGDVEAQERSVAFLFPGLGDQYPGMGAELYRLEPAFRDAIDRCAELLRPQLGRDLREVLFPEGTDGKAEEEAPARPDLRRLLGAEPEPEDGATRRLRRTALAHPAVFAVEYALAQLWMEWGIRPTALIGYSLGEYVAACLAGVLSLEDALRLVADRARLVDALPPGAMLAVPLPAGELEPMFAGVAADPDLSLAADNGPGLSVAGGTPEAIERLERLLADRGVVCRRLQTEHAFHSAQMEPIVAECGRLAGGMRLSPPTIPFVSNVTGTWITGTEATDPEYWARHLRRTVRFNQGIETLMAVDGDEPPRILLEVGPGQSLVTLARQHPRRPLGLTAVASLRDRREPGSDLAYLLESLGRLWLAGVAPDWSAFVSRETRHRVSLPAYPFDRKRYYVEPGKAGIEGRTPAKTGALGGAAGERKPLDEWFHAPVWERVPPATTGEETAGRWLLLLDSAGLGERLAARLEAAGVEVVRAGLAVDGGGFARRADGVYELDPRRPDDYGALLRDLAARGAVPDRVVHLWSFGPDLVSPSAADHEDLGFYSLLWLFQALGENERPERLHVAVVANGLQEVTGGEELRPEKAALLGPCRVFPQETPGVACTVLDVVAPGNPSALDRLAGRLASELAGLPQEPLLVLRGRHLWARRFRPVRLPRPETRPVRLREGGVYLIAGALRETGVVLAEHLFRTARARLALLVPRDAPPRARWDEWIGAHDESEEEVRRMRRLLALETEGCELLVLPYELTRADRVKVAVERVRERFGTLHGVIHAAGEDGAGLLQWKTRDAAQTVLAPKVQGTLALAEAARGENLDFFVLFGSRASVLGGFGQGDTCAAGSFLDAFAQQEVPEDGPVVRTIDWDFFRWQPVTAADPALAEQLRRGLDLYGITARECTEVFDRVLASPLPQVVVSTQDLETQLGAWSATDVLEGLAKSAAPGTAHARPDLATPYAEPESDIEKTVAAVWQEAFGIDKVGVHDNFFDLAGNSLLAVQIVSRLATSFGIKLSITSLLESPTVAELSQRIGDELTASLPAEVDQDEMERILREIEALSADEAQERLTGGTA